MEKRNLTDTPLSFVIFSNWYATFLRCIVILIWLFSAAFIVIWLIQK